MSTPLSDPVMARQQAAANRQRAETEKLPNARERLLQSAEVWDRVADQADRTRAAAAKNAEAKTDQADG